MKDLTNGQHTKTRQHHNSTYTTTSECNFMLFYAFKMSVSIASLRVNASDWIWPLNLHFLDQALFFQIYIDGPPGVPGVSKDQNFIFTYKSVQFLADKTYKIGFLGFLV